VLRKGSSIEVVRKWVLEQQVRSVEEEGIVRVGTGRMGQVRTVVLGGRTVVLGVRRQLAVGEADCIAVEVVVDGHLVLRKGHMAFFEEDHVGRIDHIPERGVCMTF